jgi:hypothetical protein
MICSSRCAAFLIMLAGSPALAQPDQIVPAKAPTVVIQPAPVPPPPSPLATELAELLSPNQFYGLRFVDEKAAARDLASQLGGSTYAPRGMPCDVKQPECAAAARAVAAKFAPRVSAASRKRINLAYARLFDGRMTAAEMRQSIAFLRTAAGKAMAKTIRTPAPEAGAAELRRIFTEVLHVRDTSTHGMIEEFYDRTEGLPRRVLPAAPPPFRIAPQKSSGD